MDKFLEDEKWERENPMVMAEHGIRTAIEGLKGAVCRR